MTIALDPVRMVRDIDPSWLAPVLRPDAPIAHTAEGLRVGRKGSLSVASDCRWFDHESNYRRLLELPKSLHEQVTQVVPREWKARR